MCRKIPLVEKMSDEHPKMLRATLVAMAVVIGALLVYAAWEYYWSRPENDPSLEYVEEVGGYLEKCTEGTARGVVQEEPFHPAQFYVESTTLQMFLAMYQRQRPDRYVTKIVRADFVDGERDAIDVLLSHVGVEGKGYDVLRVFHNTDIVILREFVPGESIWKQLASAEEHQRAMMNDISPSFVRVTYPCLPICQEENDGMVCVNKNPSPPRNPDTQFSSTGTIDAQKMPVDDVQNGDEDMRILRDESLKTFRLDLEKAYNTTRPDRTLVEIVSMQHPVSTGQSQVELTVGYALKHDGQYGREVLRYTPPPDDMVEILREHV